MVIFDRKSLKPEMTIGEVPSTFYGLSQSGWMDSELFEEWLKNHFLLYAPPARPLLLLLDGHSPHYQLELLQIAAAEGIIIFCLPPHATHILQPLDNGAFGAIKQHWSEACHRYCSHNPGKVVNRYNFSEVFRSAWVEGMTMKNIIASFHHHTRTVLYLRHRSGLHNSAAILQLTAGGAASTPHTSVFSSIQVHIFIC